PAGKICDSHRRPRLAQRRQRRRPATGFLLSQVSRSGERTQGQEHCVSGNQHRDLRLPKTTCCPNRGERSTKKHSGDIEVVSFVCLDSETADIYRELLK